MVIAQDRGLSIKGVSKHFGDVVALKKINLDVRPGEFLTLLGPSGCGKTTLLRIIAGLEVATSGQVALGDEDISPLPANKRPVNTVFQSYALFPHLTVYENVAFGLRSRKVPEEELDNRVCEQLALLHLEPMRDRYSHEMSGGQRQRVALARALVNDPEVLLLDEPMSALDAKLRAQIQVDLRRIQRKLKRTFVLVTHDQSEALMVSDRIAVMKQAEIVQIGTPQELYEHPKNSFVAEFMGAENTLKGQPVDGGIKTDFGFFKVAEELPAGDEVTVVIRPEHIQILTKQPEENGVQVKVRESVYMGANIDIWLEPVSLRVRTGTKHLYADGESVWLKLPADDLVPLDD